MRNLITLTLFILLLCIGVHGQTFDSGSTGADGPFNPPTPSQMPPGTQVDGACTMASPCTVTVPLLPNGIFHFTTVTIGPYVTVKFRRNAANTPVFILAQGDVMINGTMDVSGQNAVRSIINAAQGGPGGFNGGIGGVPGSLTGAGGAGGGPGGGGGGGSASCGVCARGAGGGFGSLGQHPTCSEGPCGLLGAGYGIPELLPLIGGSGGGGGKLGGVVPAGNGGGGGGALLMASSTVINLGAGSGNPIIANGGVGSTDWMDESLYSGGGGSGGAIRLVAPALRGSGSRTIIAIGGRGGDQSNPNNGGVGRIRLEAFRHEYMGSTNPSASFNEPGQIGPVFPPIKPTVRLVSVAGAMVPNPPTADISTADLTLPPTFTNPVPVVVEAMHVPSGTQARVIVAPQLGAGPRTITTPVMLTGPTGEPKRGMVNVTIPIRGVGIISAVIDTVVPEP